MNKPLHLILTVCTLLAVLPTHAGEVTIDMSAQGFVNAQDVTSITQGGVTITVAKHDGRNGPKYYISDKTLHLYAKNTLTVSADVEMASIAIAFSRGDNSMSYDNTTLSEGTATYGNPTTWTGASRSVTFTNTTSASDKWFIASITVTTQDAPALPEVGSIAELRQLADGSQVRLTFGRDNPGNIEWVNNGSETHAYVRDNGMAVCFTNFLPDDAGWHTTAGGALIGSVDGEYHFRNGMPEFIHIDTSIADSILCLDYWQGAQPVAVSELSALAGTDFRADYVSVSGVSLATDDGENYTISDGEAQVAMTDAFGLGADLPADLSGREFTIEGILGASSDGSTSTLYYTRIEEVIPTLTLAETSYGNGGTIGTYDGRNVVVDVERTLATGMWNTLCLPFDIYGFSSIVASAQLAEFTGYDTATNTLEFSSVEDLKAGVPYLVLPTEEVDNIHIQGATISSQLTTVSHGTYDMVGIFDPTTLHAGDEGILFLGPHNTLRYPNVTNDLKAFRAYFRTTSDAPANICIDGITSDIRIATLDDSREPEHIYNVSGQLVGTSKQQLQKGVYVSRGNKVIIK